MEKENSEQEKGGRRSRFNSKRNDTLDGFIFTVYMPYMRLRKRSWLMDERISRKYISPYLGHISIGKIQAAQIADWQTELANSGFSASSCNRFLATLKTIFNIAEVRGAIMVGSSPARHIHPLKSFPFRERCLSMAEGRKLMEYLAASDDIRARAIELILLTGARKNEILKARWEDIAERILTVPVSKSGKARYIVLSDEALKTLGRIKRTANCPWLFPGQTTEKPLRDIYTFWDVIRKELGLENVRIHDLRHTFASFLINGGHSLYEIQKLLGHADPRTTMRYAHLDIASLVDATQQISLLLK